jgi:hypothetical protein
MPPGTNIRLWLTGWTETIAEGEFVSVVVDIADEGREAAPDADPRGGASRLR